MTRAQYLSEGWFELNLAAASGWPERSGVDCAANYEVIAAPGGRARYHAVITDGRLVEMAQGRLDEADVTISYRYEDVCAEIAQGDHPDLAFMTGRMKLEGDYACWLFGLRPLLSSAEYGAYRAELAASTDFLSQ